MKYIAFKQIVRLGPCDEYLSDNCARLRALFAGRKRVTIRTALLHPDVPADDRLWLGVALLPDQARREFACGCAERALTREREAGREPDPRLWAAVETAWRYSCGVATDQELSAASEAAWNAVRKIVNYGYAGAAASEAAGTWAATRAAAGYAWAAAREAAGDAWIAAGDAEQQCQLGRLIELVENAE